jgi:hypothetical protein
MTACDNCVRLVTERSCMGFITTIMKIIHVIDIVKIDGWLLSVGTTILIQKWNVVHGLTRKTRHSKSYTKSLAIAGLRLPNTSQDGSSEILILCLHNFTRNIDMVNLQLWCVYSLIGLHLVIVNMIRHFALDPEIDRVAAIDRSAISQFWHDRSTRIF